MTRPTQKYVSDLRLTSVMQARLAVEGSYVALASAITAKNPDERVRGDCIDRRKLKKIVNGDKALVLSLKELHLLDKYLEPLGHGLAYSSIFKRPNVLESLADAKHPVTFLLGSRTLLEYQLHLSHWDVNALAEIQRGVNKFAPHVMFDIRDVLLHSKLEDAVKSVTKGNWMKLLDKDGPSLVCLGSGRANHATEAILCAMFGVSPFDDSEAAKRGLPFHFIWTGKRKDDFFPSAFHRSAGAVSAPTAVKRALKAGSSGLVTEESVYVDTLSRTHTGRCYGVCVAQRRSNGQIWVVLAGVSGPATYAVGQFAERLAFNLHSRPTGEDSPVIWAVLQGTLRRDRRRAVGTFLSVTSPEIISGPHEWRPA